MSWIFSQAMMQDYANSHSLQGRVVAFSQENSWDGEPCAQLNVMPTQAKFWRNDKTMEFSRLSQFGLTLQLLTESRGKELLTWYLAGFHAKTLAQQEKAQESKANEAECGKKWHGLLAKYDLLTRSWKTAQCSLLEDLEQSLQTWHRWGSMRNGACYLRPMLVQIINENESGLSQKIPNNLDFFHTPNTTGLDGGSNSRKALKKREQWPTPDANLGARGTQPDWQPTRKSGQPAQYTLNQVVRDSIKFPTPTAHNAKEQNSPSESARNTPSLASIAGGKLNPNWVEWLMNWPMKWTELKNEYECNTQESAKSDFNTWLELSSMQFNGKLTQTPSRLQQAVGCGNNLREMPRKATRFRALEESHENKSMPKLQKYIHIQTGKTKDVQPILRSQTSLGESWWEKEPNIGRVANGVSFSMDRLKAIGNGQVPLCAARAFELLRARLDV